MERVVGEQLNNKSFHREQKFVKQPSQQNLIRKSQIQDCNLI